MPVPLPVGEASQAVPESDEVFQIARGIVTAVQGEHGLTDLQYHVIAAHIVEMTGVHVNPDYLEPLGPAEFANALRDRDERFRLRMVQLMLLGAFMLDPIPEHMVDRIRAYAQELSVDDDMIEVARHHAMGALELVSTDFARAGYHDHIEGDDDDDVDIWASVEHDEELAARWAALEQLPESTLGHQVWQFYRSRGFHFPGTPGSASPFLSQHDWIHVIADYGSTVESEIEVFGLISRANGDLHGFSLLAMVLSLFESGLLQEVAIFQHDPRHMSRNARKMGVRLADAMYRGAQISSAFDGRNLLEVDWLALADRDIDDIRIMIGIPPKSAAAVRAGSVGPWEPGGISPVQVAMGQTMAGQLGIEYDPHGASVLDVDAMH